MEEKTNMTYEDEKKVRIVEKAPFLTKMFRILFWLIIPNTIAAIMMNETFSQNIPVFSAAGKILKLVCLLVYAIVLLKLSAEDSNYNKAGKFAIIIVICSAISYVILSLNDGWLYLIIAIPETVISIMCEYYEYSAHAELLFHIDNQLADRWENLWKWMIGAYIALAGCILVTLLVPVLGLVLMIIVGIVFVVLSIRKLVYLYKMAKLFEKYRYQ